MYRYLIHDAVSKLMFIPALPQDCKARLARAGVEITNLILITDRFQQYH